MIQPAEDNVEEKEVEFVEVDTEIDDNQLFSSILFKKIEEKYGNSYLYKGDEEICQNQKKQN